MRIQKNLIVFFLFQATLVFYLLPFVISSKDYNEILSTQSKNNDNHIKMSPRLQFEIKVHGFLLWASMGFLMPVGILAIRLSSNIEENPRRVKIVFYLHAILQMVGVLLATAGAIMSIKNFNNLFNNNHQRLGVALYAIIWLQLLLGIFRPQRRSKRRSVWFFAHWILGTAVSFLGVLNVYIGLVAYHEKTSKGIRIWIMLFTIEISLVVFFYLLQEKWVYIQKQQRVICGNEMISQSCQESQQNEKQKKVLKADTC